MRGAWAAATMTTRHPHQNPYVGAGLAPAREGTSPSPTLLRCRLALLAELLGKRDNDALRPADVG
jgi:hypothetical protein